MPPETESRVQKALKNSLWSILGHVAPIITALFVTPIIVFGLGEVDYGIYTFFVSVVALLGLLDLGVSTAITRQITQYYGNGEIPRIRTLIASANTLAVLIGVIGFIACVGLGAGGDKLLTGAVAPHALQYYILTGLIFLINSISFVFVTIPTALQRFDISTKIGTTLLVFSALASIIAVRLGYGIAGLLIVQLFLSTASTLAFRFYANRILPHVATSRLGWSLTEIKGFYAFGLKTSLMNIGSVSQAYLSRMIIPFFLGPSALTYYSVPGSVAAKIPGITSTLTGVIFPITTDLSVRGEKHALTSAYVRSFRLITILAAAATTAIISFAPLIMLHWLDETFRERSTTILVLLTLAHFLLALYGHLYNFLIGLGRQRMLTIGTFIMTGINALALLVLLPRWHIEGAAWAYLISSLPILYMLYYTDTRYVGLTRRAKFYGVFGAKILITALSSYLVSLFALIPMTTNLAALIFTGPIAVCVFLVLYRLFGFYEKEDLRDLSTFLGKLLFRRSRSSSTFTS